MMVASFSWEFLDGSLYRTQDLSYEEINERIRQGEAVVVTAEEIIDRVAEQGVQQAAKRGGCGDHWDLCPHVLLRGLLKFRPHLPQDQGPSSLVEQRPPLAGLGAADIYIGATEPAEDDPLNKVYSGGFEYEGGRMSL
jgi:uncharacterized protein (DUF39 family)